MGRRCILPSSSIVPRFAIMVIERSLSISTELRTAGLVVIVVVEKRLVIFFTLLTLRPTGKENVLFTIPQFLSAGSSTTTVVVMFGRQALQISVTYHQ